MAAVNWFRTQLRETLRVFAGTPRVLTLVWRASPRRVLALALLTVIQGLIPGATVWIGKHVVDGTVAAIQSGGDEAAIRHLIGLVGLQFAVGAGGIALGHVSSFVQQALSDLVGHRMSVQVLAKANTLDLAYFETPEFYDKLRNAQRLGSQPVQLVTGGLLQLVRNVIVVSSMVAFLWSFHPLLPVAILLASLPHLIAQMYYGRYGWRLMHWQAPLYRKQNYLGSVMTGDTHAKEVRLFGLGDLLLGRYVETALEVLRQNWDLRTRQRRTSSLLSLVSTATASVAYLYIVLETAAGRITLGDLTLYSAAVSQTQGTLMGVLGSVTSVYETNLQVNDLFTFLDYKPKIASGPRRLPVPVPLQHGIEFRDVSFRYPFSPLPNDEAVAGDPTLAQSTPETERDTVDGHHAAAGHDPPARRDRAVTRGAVAAGTGTARTMVAAPAGNGPARVFGRRGGPPWSRFGGWHVRSSSEPRRGPAQVLRGVSFAIPAGKTVALVGANGAGKTTLVKLLSRLYDPTGGQVLLDGVDLREYDLDDVRRQIGVVFQDYARYQLPVRDNIGFGQVEYLDDQARIACAAAQGGAEPVIRRLPQGYETMLGRWFAGGIELSGGEWQKIALARGFMRETPQILVLDEPTASLDAQAEYEIYERFHDLTRGKTTLLISHRFSTVRMADHIVVLERGCVVEQGPHDALVAAGGTYARLYEMQARRYR